MNVVYRGIWFVAVVVGLFVLPVKVQAHPSPYVIQELFFHFHQDKIVLEYTIRIDPIVVNKIIPQFDTDDSADVDDAELKVFAQEVIIPNLTSTLNGNTLEYSIVSAQGIEKKDITSFNSLMQITFEAIPEQLNADRNEFYANYNYKFIPDDPFGDSFFFSDNTTYENIEELILNRDVEVDEGDFYIDYTINGYVPPPQETRKEDAAATKNFITKTTNRAKDMAFAEGNWLFAVLALLVAFVAGALHAMTPGHGKSFMSALLIARNKSSFTDVLILGASITVAHTAVIYAMGFILLTLQMQDQANRFEPYLIKASMVLMIILALNLLYGGYKKYRMHKLRKTYRTPQQQKSYREYTFKTKQHRIRSRWDLLYAGISGGIIPCLDALLIFFAAVNVGRIGLGLVLIAFFSFGLATTIIGIGYGIIQGKKALKIEKKLGTTAEIYGPMLSGTFILILALYIFIR